MSINFPTSGVTPYPGNLPAIAIKGIGPGSAIVTASIDFTKMATVGPLNNGASYKGCFLDFTASAGSGNMIDSIRSIKIDNTQGTMASEPVYVVCPDTQDIVVAPPNSLSSWRVHTNTTQLYAYQEAAQPSQINLFAMNYIEPDGAMVKEFDVSPLGENDLASVTAFRFTATTTTNIPLTGKNIYIDYIDLCIEYCNIVGNLIIKDSISGTVFNNVQPYIEGHFRSDVKAFLSGGFNLQLLCTMPPIVPYASLIAGDLLMYGQLY